MIISVYCGHILNPQRFEYPTVLYFYLIHNSDKYYQQTKFEFECMNTFFLRYKHKVIRTNLLRKPTIRPLRRSNEKRPYSSIPQITQSITRKSFAFLCHFIK